MTSYSYVLNLTKAEADFLKMVIIYALGAYDALAPGPNDNPKPYVLEAFKEGLIEILRLLSKSNKLVVSDVASQYGQLSNIIERTLTYSQIIEDDDIKDSLVVYSNYLDSLHKRNEKKEVTFWDNDLIGLKYLTSTNPDLCAAIIEKLHGSRCGI